MLNWAEKINCKYYKNGKCKNDKNNEYDIFSLNLPTCFELKFNKKSCYLKKRKEINEKPKE